jgi:hypothetical protein
VTTGEKRQQPTVLIFLRLDYPHMSTPFAAELIATAVREPCLNCDLSIDFMPEVLGATCDVECFPDCLRLPRDCVVSWLAGMLCSKSPVFSYLYATACSRMRFLRPERASLLLTRASARLASDSSRSASRTTRKTAACTASCCSRHQVLFFISIGLPCLGCACVALLPSCFLLGSL